MHLAIFAIYCANEKLMEDNETFEQIGSSDEACTQAASVFVRSGLTRGDRHQLLIFTGMIPGLISKAEVVGEGIFYISEP